MLVRPDVDPLMREQQRIEARRMRNDERAKRILDPRIRTMGIDKDILSEQIAEKAERLKKEKEANDFHDRQSNKHAEIIVANHQQRRLDARLREKELLEFRELQAAEHREKKRNSTPGSEPSTDQAKTQFLKFTGEDLDHENRVKAQQLQIQDWLGQQIQLQRAREDGERAENFAYDQKQLDINIQIRRLQDEKISREAAARHQLHQAHVGQIEEVRFRREQTKQNEQRLGLQEIDHQLNSALLNELTQTRRDNSSRPVAPHFKGFSVDQRAAIQNEQAHQVATNKSRSEQEIAENAAWAAKVESDRKKLIMMHRAKEAQTSRDRMSLADAQRKQAVEHAEREKYLKRSVYVNPVDASFFDQFGKGGR